MEGLQQNSEKAMPKVVLHFLRHSIKEKAPEKADKDIRLTNEGRKLSAERYTEPLNTRFGHIAGSPRIRTHETAAVAATKNPDTNPEDLGIGKVRTHNALDFELDDSTEYGKKFYKEFMGGKAMPFLLHESDILARESGDMISSTYSKMAANIAGIIYRNYETASRGASILEQSQNPTNETNNFERIFATHATTQECFLLKLIEKMRGTVAQEELLKVIGDNSFGYTEGFDTTLSKEGGQEQIRITYKKGECAFDEIVPISVIEEIIEEGK